MNFSSTFSCMESSLDTYERHFRTPRIYKSARTYLISEKDTCFCERPRQRHSVLVGGREVGQAVHKEEGLLGDVPRTLRRVRLHVALVIFVGQAQDFLRERRVWNTGSRYGGQGLAVDIWKQFDNVKNVIPLWLGAKTLKEV